MLSENILDQVSLADRDLDLGLYLSPITARQAQQPMWLRPDGNGSADQLFLGRKPTRLAVESLLMSDRFIFAGLLLFFALALHQLLLHILLNPVSVPVNDLLRIQQPTWRRCLNLRLHLRHSPFHNR